METVVLLVILAVLVWKLLIANRFGLARKRYAITLKDGEGEFVGDLVERRWARLTFDKCMVPPTKPSEAPTDVPGRLRIERVNISYLQELPRDNG